MRRLVPFVAVAMCIGLLRAGPAAGQGVGAVPRDVPGVANFAQVSPSLYRGAQPTREGFAELKKMGIRTIVSLRTSSDRKKLKGSGLWYARISSEADEIGENEVAAFLKIMADPANHPVFVHCRRGADRTGCAVAAYRIVEQAWSVENALVEMRRFRFNEDYVNIPRCLKRLDPIELREKAGRANAPRVELVK